MNNLHIAITGSTEEARELMTGIVYDAITGDSDLGYKNVSVINHVGEPCLNQGVDMTLLETIKAHRPHLFDEPVTIRASEKPEHHYGPECLDVVYDQELQTEVEEKYGQGHLGLIKDRCDGIKQANELFESMRGWKSGDSSSEVVSVLITKEIECQMIKDAETA